jgi:hypothetical protein
MAKRLDRQTQFSSLEECVEAYGDVSKVEVENLGHVPETYNHDDGITIDNGATTLLYAGSDGAAYLHTRTLSTVEEDHGTNSSLYLVTNLTEAELLLAKEFHIDPLTLTITDDVESIFFKEGEYRDAELIERWTNAYTVNELPIGKIIVYRDKKYFVPSKYVTIDTQSTAAEVGEVMG